MPAANSLSRHSSAPWREVRVPDPHPMATFDPTAPARLHEQLKGTLYHWPGGTAKEWRERTKWHDRAKTVVDLDGLLLDAWSPFPPGAVVTPQPHPKAGRQAREESEVHGSTGRPEPPDRFNPIARRVGRIAGNMLIRQLMRLFLGRFLR